MLVKPYLTFNLKLKLSRIKRFLLAIERYRLIWIVAIVFT